MHIQNPPPLQNPVQRCKINVNCNSKKKICLSAILCMIWVSVLAYLLIVNKSVNGEDYDKLFMPLFFGATLFVKVMMIVVWSFDKFPCIENPRFIRNSSIDSGLGEEVISIGQSSIDSGIVGDGNNFCCMNIS